MSSEKIGFEESLKSHVVDAGKCAGCAACVVSCPFFCLEYSDGKPKLIKECESCGICLRVCPRYQWNTQEMEKHVFGRQHSGNEPFGVFRRVVLARAVDEEILERCQDGGLVSALLAFALEHNVIEAAVVSGVSSEKPFHPVPQLATTREQILECSGTRYTYSPNMLALQEAAKQKKKAVAFVGTPCQIQALRKMEVARLKKYVAPIKFAIGLMCTESFTYEGLIEEHIKNRLGISPEQIKKMNIKGKIIVETLSGEEKIIPLKEAKAYTRQGCHHCRDFSSELADISAGGLGLTNWTFAVIRTEKGEKIFESAEKAGAITTKPVDKEGKAWRLLHLLSNKKRGVK